jgi:ABC-type phosphate transport system substrate-binding protein
VKVRQLRCAKLLVVVAALLAALIPLSPALAAPSFSFTAINGSGSTWSSVALDQWAQNLHANGITINFNPDGSAAGRADYMAQQVDFAASDPPFRTGSDPFNTGGGEHPNVGYSYVPDTAGGTAFMYHLDVGGRLITNLRLSGQTIMKIFTGQITNWNDAAITKDYGAKLPSVPIIPVIRADGSGATFFFTRWMAHEFPAQWNAFCKRIDSHVTLPCGQTEFYPQNWGQAKAENGSNNVASYITASYGQGTIGYDEYAYALNSHYPVVKVLNAGGYYVLPTASNVAVALTQAQINTDASSPLYLQQNLDSVYAFTDPRSYPLSSYSYLVVPRQGKTVPTNFTPAAGKTLSTYIDYFLCAGQRYSAELGYSPLPLNLVQGGLAQAAKIPGAVPEPNIGTSCQNPTFTNGVLTVLKDAPRPNHCDKFGAPLTCNPNGTSSSPSPGASSSASASAGTGPTTGPTAPTTSVGQPGGTTVSQGPVTGQVVNLASNDSSPALVGGLTAALILVAIAAPPALYGLLRRRRRLPR